MTKRARKKILRLVHGPLKYSWTTGCEPAVLQYICSSSVLQRLLYCFQKKAALSMPVILVFMYSVILLLLHRCLQLSVVSLHGFQHMEFVCMWWMSGTSLSVVFCTHFQSTAYYCYTHHNIKKSISK